MPDAESLTLREARRIMEVCNACRYCGGFCAVFPAMEKRRAFAAGDLEYLANLCHNCTACFHACQYAPPQEFDLNVPKVMAELRAESYEKYVWPTPLSALFRRNGLLVSLLAAAVVMLVLFIWHSRVDENPILDLTLFKNRVFAFSNAALFFFGAGFLCGAVIAPAGACQACFK